MGDMCNKGKPVHKVACMVGKLEVVIKLEKEEGRGEFITG